MADKEELTPSDREFWDQKIKEIKNPFGESGKKQALGDSDFVGTKYAGYTKEQVAALEKADKAVYGDMVLLEEDEYGFLSDPKNKDIIVSSEKEVVVIEERVPNTRPWKCVYKRELFIFYGPPDANVTNYIKFFYFALFSCVVYLRRHDESGFRKTIQILEGQRKYSEKLATGVSRGISDVLYRKGNEDLLKFVSNSLRLAVAEEIGNIIANGGGVDSGLAEMVIIKKYRELIPLPVEVIFSLDIGTDLPPIYRTKP